MEWVLSEKGNVGMSTWEEKGNEKTPIPLLPKPIALQKHHKVYLADDDDQLSSCNYKFQISIVGIWYQIYLFLKQLNLIIQIIYESKSNHVS